MTTAQAGSEESSCRSLHVAHASKGQASDARRFLGEVPSAVQLGGTGVRLLTTRDRNAFSGRPPRHDTLAHVAIGRPREENDDADELNPGGGTK
jgi:hypothetical protein